MGPPAHLVTIKRSGVDGHHFPLSLSTCLFGRGIECDIRIQLPIVSKQHCKIEVHGLEAVLFNLSSTNPTQVNGSAIDEPVQLKHGDVITVVDRSFRYENESHQNGSKSSELPGQRHEQESRRWDSRSSFSSDPDGKVQDSKAHSKLTEENISGRPLGHAQNIIAAGTDSGGPEDLVAGKTLNAVHSSELPGSNRRHGMDPTAGDFEKDSSVASVNCDGALKSFPPIQCLENSEKNKSPFRKLYESLKEELDVKLEKENVLQNRRRSESKSRRTAEQESAGGLQGETQLLASLKRRRRSRRSTQVKADPASGEGSSQAEADGREEKPSQSPKLTGSPGTFLTRTPKTNTPVQPSQQNSSRKRRSEDLGAVSGRASVSLDQSGGSRADNKIFTPAKVLTRNQTPTKTENTDKIGNTPEKLFSKKKQSISTNVDVLSTDMDIQSQTLLAPLVIQVEKEIGDDSAAQPEKPGPPAGRVCAVSPGLSSADVGNFGDASGKIEGMALKRRRVSFGSHLRPELFDENLPPNTPLKRGETPKKRKSLVTLTPPVLKKIIKERPRPSGNEGSSEIPVEVPAQNVFTSSPACSPTDTPAANGQRRGSCTAPSISTSKSPHPTAVPKRGGRRSSNLPSKRMSIDRSQRNILQMVYSRRRSGASEANLIVAKSWADVVKLGAKQSQPKVGKHGPQRQLNKRQRRASTPKRPTGSAHKQFSTGHANSPCTIIIGKAHTEKIHMPARPYRMLNNFVFNKKMDFNEDLSGLTEMFKTPAKEKPQPSVCPTTFSDSENSLGKTFQVPDLGETPLLCTSENLGGNMFPGTQNAPKELSDTSSASPPLRRPSIRVNADSVKTPRNVCKTPGAEMRTPRLEAASPKTASSANKFRRSAQLPGAQVPGVEGENRKEETEPYVVASGSGRCLRKTPLREEKPEGEMKESGKSSGTCKMNIESKENSEKMMTMRRSRSSEQKCEPTADLTALPPSQDAKPKEDLADVQSPLQAPGLSKEPGDAESTELRCKSPKQEPVTTPPRTNTPPKTPLGRLGVREGHSALRTPTQTPGGATASHREPGGDDKGVTLLKRTPKQKQDPAGNVTGLKRRPRTPKGKAQLLEDLAGLRELFQTPVHAKEPVTGELTTKMPCKSLQAEPVITPTSNKGLQTPLGRVRAREGLSALRTPTQTPGGDTASHREPGGDDKGITLLKGTPKLKQGPTENITGLKRRPRTPKGKAQLLEDLAGLSELFQTPNHAKEHMTDEHTTNILCPSPQPELVTTSPSLSRRLRASPCKVDVEELSALRKPTQTPGATMSSPRQPGGGERGIAVSQEARGQKVDPAEYVTGSKRRPRTPKGKTQFPEDLTGLRELFQTPVHAKEPVTGEHTTKMPCKSLQAEPVITPTSNKGLQTPLGRVRAREGLLAVRTATQTPGGDTESHGEPGSDDKGVTLLKGTPKLKQGPTENITGPKRKPRTPKGKAQLLEDLAGLSELFQTPNHAKEHMTDEHTTNILCPSPQPELVTTSPSLSRRLRAPPCIVDVEELSALRKPTHTPGATMSCPRQPGRGERGIAVSQEAPEQKVDPAEYVTGSKRRPRTPKGKAQLLEDLAGLRELFQTPVHAKEPVTGEHTTKMPCKSLQAEPVITPTSNKGLQTPLGRVRAREGLSALRTATQTPGGATESHGEPGGDDKGVTLLKGTPKLKQGPTENITGLKRRPRTPKGKAQLLEDLAGLSELFQTPNHAKEHMTDEHTTNILCPSPQPELVTTSPSLSRRLRASPCKVNVEELSALRKPTQTPGATMSSPRQPGGGERGIAVSQEARGQKVDPAEYVTGSKRRPRTPKGKAQLLEDLAGLRELFQTPVHAKEPVTSEHTTKMPCKSLQAEPVITPTSNKGLQTPLGRVRAREGLSAVRTATQTPGGAIESHGEPGSDDKGVTLLKGTPKLKQGPTEDITGPKRKPRTPKGKAQLLEDLAGLSELFQTPNHAKEHMTDEHTTNILCPSPQPELVTTSPSLSRRLRASPCIVDVEELSALRKPTHTPGATMSCPRQPGGGERGIAVSQEAPEQKVDPAEYVTGSKRRPRTPKGKAQLLEDLAGLRELFQTPVHAKEPVTGEHTTKMPCKSLQAEPVITPTSNKGLQTPLGRVRTREGLSALRTATQTPGGATESHGEPGGDDKGVTLLKGTPKLKQGPTENITGLKRRPRTPKGKAQLLEDLAGLSELFQTPNHAKEPVTDEHTTTILCPSPAEPVTIRTSRKRRLRTPVDLGGEVSALRKPTHQQPGGDGKGIPLFRETARQKLDSEGNITRTKRRPRACKEKAQPLEDLAGCKGHFRMSDHAKGPTANDQTTEEPCKPLDAELVPTRTSKKRQLKAPPQKAVARAEIPALRTASHRDLQGGDKGVTLLKEPAEPKQDCAGNVTGTKRRPRTCKEKAQPLEDLPGCKELVQTPEHAKELGHDTESTERSPKQTQNRRNPVKISGRALRALKVKPTEDLVGPTDPVKPQSESSISLPPKRKRGKDGSVTGTKRLPSLTVPQESGDEKPLRKRRRECHGPPEAPVIKKSLRILAKRIEPVEDLPSNHMKMKKPGREVEDVTSADQVMGMSLRSRCPNKINVEEQRPELLISEEKIKIKRNEKKSTKTSRELKLQNPEEGARSSIPEETPGGGRCLRSGRLNKGSLPNAAGEESVGIHGKNQEEKEGKEHAGLRSLRSRKITVPPAGTAAESEFEQRVTRRAKRCAENIKKDDDNMGIKKMRTRSCRNTEDI